MAEEPVYLELSEEGGGSHKFYELIVVGTQVRIRFGRIGDAGQTKARDYSTAALAQTFADKKIREKPNKGYERAVMGLRQKQRGTRRAIVSNRSTASQPPACWTLASCSAAS